MSRSNFYKNYYQSFMNENMNPLYRRYLEYLSSDLPDVSDIGGFIDVPTTAEREGLESLLDTTRIPLDNLRRPMGPMAPMNQQREGGGGPRTGRFGNLDPTSERMVLIDGVPTRVYTDASGLLKTFDGRNVKGEVNTQTGAFDYEADAYGIPSIYGASFPPSFGSGNEFSLDKVREKAIKNQFEYDRKVQEEAERKAKEEAEKKAAEEKAKRDKQQAEIDRIRQQDEARYRQQKGEYGGPDRQTEREQAGPGYDNVSEAGSF